MSAKSAGVGMVVGQAVDVMLQRVKRRGGDDAGLAHAAAEHFAMPPGLLASVARPGQCRADRRPQALC